MEDDGGNSTLRSRDTVVVIMADVDEDDDDVKVDDGDKESVDEK
jgi:hypothetical protein